MSAEERGSEGSGLEHEQPVLERKLGLAEMLDVATFGEVVRSLADLYRVGIRVLDARGARLVEARGGSTDLCGLVGGCGEGRSRCAALVARVDEGPLVPTPGAQRLPGASPPGGELMVVPCFTGLRYLVMPVLWEGDTLGRVVFGPFAPDTLAEPPPSLREVEGVELARVGELLAALGRLSEEQVGRMLVHFAQMISALLALSWAWGWLSWRISQSPGRGSCNLTMTASLRALLRTSSKADSYSGCSRVPSCLKSVCLRLALTSKASPR